MNPSVAERSEGKGVAARFIAPWGGEGKGVAARFIAPWGGG